MVDNGTIGYAKKEVVEIVAISRTNLNKVLMAVCIFGFAGGLVVMYGIMTVNW